MHAPRCCGAAARCCGTTRPGAACCPSAGRGSHCQQCASRVWPFVAPPSKRSARGAPGGRTCGTGRAAGGGRRPTPTRRGPPWRGSAGRTTSPGTAGWSACPPPARGGRQGRGEGSGEWVGGRRVKAAPPRGSPACPELTSSRAFQTKQPGLKSTANSVGHAPLKSRSSQCHPARRSGPAARLPRHRCWRRSPPALGLHRRGRAWGQQDWSGPCLLQQCMPRRTRLHGAPGSLQPPRAGHVQRIPTGRHYQHAQSCRAGCWAAAHACRHVAGTASKARRCGLQRCTCHTVGPHNRRLPAWCAFR